MPINFKSSDEYYKFCQLEILKWKLIKEENLKDEQVRKGIITKTEYNSYCNTVIYPKLQEISKFKPTMLKNMVDKNTMNTDFNDITTV